MSALDNTPRELGIFNVMYKYNTTAVLFHCIEKEKLNKISDQCGWIYGTACELVKSSKFQLKIISTNKYRSTMPLHDCVEISNAL